MNKMEAFAFTSQNEAIASLGMNKFNEVKGVEKE